MKETSLTRLAFCAAPNTAAGKGEGKIRASSIWFTSPSWPVKGELTVLARVENPGAYNWFWCSWAGSGQCRIPLQVADPEKSCLALAASS